MKPRFDVVCFGEILFDLLESGPRPGGAPMNVCFHLNQMGLKSTLISRLSDDARGHQLLAFLDSHHIPSNYIQQDKIHPTGTVQVNLDRDGIAHYNIVAPVAWDFISMNEALLDLVRNAPIFIYGSLAARHQVSRDTLMQCLDKTIYRVMDINLRAPHYEMDILTSLIKKANLLKLNEEELDILVSNFGTLLSIEDKIRELSERYLLDNIIVTLGDQGAVYFEGDQFYRQNAFSVDIIDTVGSGDGFLAAFLYAKYMGRLPQDCLRVACAYGALVASHSGATPTITQQSILSMISGHLS